MTMHAMRPVRASALPLPSSGKLCGLFAAILLSASVCAEQWFAVVRPGSDAAAPLVEVDLNSVRTKGVSGEGVIRVTSDVLQPHGGGFGYRSFVATAQFDCSRGSISLRTAAYYPLPSGQGVLQGIDNAEQQAGMPPHLLESIPRSVRQALLKASCATPHIN